MVRRIFCVSVTAVVLFTAPVLSAEGNPNEKRWFAGVAAAYTQSYFFGLINDIYATAPPSLALGVLGGREQLLTGSHHYGFEFFAARTLSTEAREENFAPTFSSQYPAGSTIYYRGIAQTLALLSVTYRCKLNPWFSLNAKLGAGARYTQATITLETISASYGAASPSGVMAIISAALGAEFTIGDFGQIGIFYRSVPAVVYPVAVGTATVRSADLFSLEWRYLFP